MIAYVAGSLWKYADVRFSVGGLSHVCSALLDEWFGMC